MKNIIITISLLLALTASSLAGSKNANKPVVPNAEEFAYVLVSHFGGKDKVLNEKETIKVLSLLQDHLPKKTGPSGLATRLSRESNVRNAARDDFNEERHALREYSAEQYVARFIKKYDRNDDGVLTRHELTDAMVNVIGLPGAKNDWKDRAIANR